MRGRDNKPVFRLKRAYDPAAPQDGIRFLVERLWPRGIKKTELQITGWIKEVAPSTELRQWFSHDAGKWREFRARYFRELEANPAAWEPLLDAARTGPVTLVYSSRDQQHNNAVALKEFLESHTRRKPASKAA
jgi:uncharacterized protein YeaO (DUF488 family)